MNKNIKKIILASTFIFISGCDFPGDPIENKNNEQDKKDKNITSGEGTKSKPYLIAANKYYGTKRTGTTFYEFELKNTNDKCKMIIYSQKSLENDYDLKANEETTTFYKNSVEDNMYSSYKFMHDGKYTLSTESKTDNDFRFGVYSPCLGHDETISTLEKKEQSFEELKKLYTFKIAKDEEKTQKINIKELNKISKVIVLDSNFEKKYSSSNVKDWEQSLEEGTYYLLVEGTKSNKETSKFSFEIIKE